MKTKVVVVGTKDVGTRVVVVGMELKVRQMKSSNSRRREVAAVAEPVANRAKRRVRRRRNQNLESRKKKKRRLNQHSVFLMPVKDFLKIMVRLVERFHSGREEN